MLYAGWERGVTSRDVVAINALADHIDHVCQLAGNCQHVCVGSDLDGGFGTEQTPTGLDSIADLQKLSPILSQRGYGDVEIDAILGENWLRFFLRHLPK
jgi:membrane dipeptidase